MFNTLKKLKGNRLPFSTGAFLIPQRSPLIHLSSKSQFSSAPGQQEVHQIPQVEDTPQYQGDFERLISKRIPEGIDPNESKKQLEKALIDSHKSPKQRRLEYIQGLQETYGPNWNYMANQKYQIAVDALKGSTLTREFKFGFQESLDNYKFEDNVDYQVLDRNDEVKAISRMSYVELGNSFVQRKFKYVLKEDEHFSRYENEFYAENYLEGKTENFIAVFNFAKNSTAQELFDLFSQFGKIKSYNLRRAFIGSPASFEVLYEDKDSALAAKAKWNQSKHNGATLYVRTIEDADYEHPVHRTLVVQGIDSSLSFQNVVEILNHHGNVMHFEMPILQQSQKLPTRDELDYYIRQNNISENGKYKINIRTKKYNVDDFKLDHDVILEENVLENDDTRPYFGDGQIIQNDVKQLRHQQAIQMMDQDRIYSKKIFGDPNEKTFEVADTSAFQITKINPLTEELLNRKDEPSLQYYLKSVQDIKAGTESSSMSLNDRIGVTNFVEKPKSYNLGYCFVTFSNTNEAKKAMLSIPLDQKIGAEEIEVTLKKEKGHIDFDPLYFIENYEKIRERLYTEKEKTEKMDRKLREDNSTDIINSFRKVTFGKEFEQGLHDYPIKDDKLREKRSPEEWIKYFEEEEELIREDTKKTLDGIFESQTEAQFSKRGQYEIETQNDEEDTSYNLGRSYSNKINNKDWSNFERALQNKQSLRTNQLKVDVYDRKRKAYEELLEEQRKLKQGISHEESRNLRNERREVNSLNQVTRLESFIERNITIEEEISAIERKREFFEQRKKANAERMAAAHQVGINRKEGGGKGGDQYFDPFKQEKRRQNVQETSNNSIERQKFVEKQAKYFDEVEKIVTGNYSGEEIEEYIERARKEKQEYNKLRPFFMETDKHGNEYITKEDERDFEEELLPEDPIARAEALKTQENLERMKEADWFKDLQKNAEEMKPYIGTMMLHGFPIESFKFEPSSDCATIDEFIERTKGQDPTFFYEKSVDEDGNEVVIKLMRYGNTWSPSLDVKSNDEFNELAKEIQDYLRENGIPEEELEYSEFNGGFKELFQMYHQRKQPTEMREVDQKIIELLMKKFPADLMEKILTCDPLKNFEEHVEMMQNYHGLKEIVEEARAMTKDDFIKYSSQQFNVRGKDGKYKKTKFDSF